MTRIFFTTLLVATLLCTHAYSQKGVNVHADPRLALLISKNRATERPEDIKVTPAPGKKESARKSDARVPTSRMDDVKKEVNDFVAERNIPVKNGKPFKPSPDDIKAQRRAHMTGSTVGAGYRGTGYRVQIYNGTSRDEAMRVKADFMRSYPGVASYLSYVAPNYRVKVGNFRRREDAMGLYQEANDTYKPCMIVPDAVGSR